MPRLKNCLWRDFDNFFNIDYGEYNYYPCLRCKHTRSFNRVNCRLNDRYRALGNNITRYIYNVLGIRNPIRLKACIKSVFLIYTRELRRELNKDKKRKSKKEVLRNLYR